MATITTKKRKKGITYRAEIRMKGHPILSRTFDRLSDAQRWAEDTEKALRSGGYLGNAPPDDMLFDDAVKKYLDEVSSKKARGTYFAEISVARRALQFFLGRTLKEITPAVAADFREKRLAEVRPSTTLRELCMLSHIFTTATREWGVAAVNPVSKIKKPSATPGRLRFLTPAEIARLLEESKTASRSNLYSYILLQLHTGMRPSEGAGLTWGQVDFDGRIIDLRKTKTDPRRVPLTVPAIETLASLIPEEGFSCEDYVFRPKSHKAYPFRANQYFRESFEAAIKRAKISDFHMHDLRHTAASYMIMNGVDLRTVADILGHKTISMTMRYTHLLNDHKLKAVDRIAHLGLE